MFQNISVHIYIAQTCKCTCRQEVLKQHLTYSPEHSLLRTSSKKKCTELVCPLGHYEDGWAIIFLRENLKHSEAISSIKGSCFGLADNYIQLKNEWKSRIAQTLFRFYSGFTSLSGWEVGCCLFCCCFFLCEYAWVLVLLFVCGLFIWLRISNK